METSIMQSTMTAFSKRALVRNEVAMSGSCRFFLEEEDSAATLEEALAFIDAFGQDDGDASAASSDDSSTSSFPLSSCDTTTTTIDSSSPQGPPLLSISPQHIDLENSSTALNTSSTDVSTSSSSSSGDDGDTNGDVADHRPKQRVVQTKRVANTKAVGRYRRRNKDEIHELREKVRQMDARLAQLRKRNNALAIARKLQCTPGSDLSPLASDPLLLEMYANLIGIDRVGLERRRLEQSLLLNQKLRDVLVNHLAMGMTLDSLFNKHISKQVRDFVTVQCAMEVLTRARYAVHHCVGPGVSLWY